VQACPTCGAPADTYDVFFKSLERDKVWGDLRFTLRDGRVVVINLQRTFKSVDEALQSVERRGSLASGPEPA